MATVQGAAGPSRRSISSNQHSSNPQPKPKSSSPFVRSSAPSTPVAAGGADRRRGKSSLPFATEASPRGKGPEAGSPGLSAPPRGNGHLVSPTGEILVNARRYPHLHRSLTRGIEIWRQGWAEWGRVAELRKTNPSEADRLVRKLLGVKGDPMPDEVKAALRARQAAMTEEEKKAARDERRAQRVLRRLAARATGRANGSIFSQEADVAKKGKAKAKTKSEKQNPTKTSVEKVSNRKAFRDWHDGQKKQTRDALKPRDQRLPASGTVLTREYLAKKHEVLVEEVGFTYDGEHFHSLTAVAKKITGAPSINGFLFFGLTNAQKVATT